MTLRSIFYVYIALGVAVITGDVILSVTGMNKRFGQTVALSDVSFTLRRGEVHGLIGENGSGKSTLSSIIAGICPYDSGEMTLYGEAYYPKNAADAQNKGISIIVQEMGTVPAIDVAENIFLGNGRSFSRFGFVNKKAMTLAAKEALLNVGADRIPANASAFTLGLEARKLIGLAKAMLGDPGILIVDETTTALTQDGRGLLYNCVERMRASDKGVIFISHDLEEIMSVCTNLTVLRDGVIIGTLSKDEFDEDKIKSMMVGRELTGDYYRSDYDGNFDAEVVMSAEGLSDGKAVKNISFELHMGEILGVGGLSGGGIHELGKLLFGIEKAVSGAVRLADGSKITSPGFAVKKSIGYVSKNRDEEAVMLNASIRNNVVLASLSRLARLGMLITGKSEKALAAQVISDMNVKCSSMEQKVKSLSGGNKQKVSFGKWTGGDANILILDCPTRGIDVGVKQAMYKLIYELKKEGRSVVLISEELTELIGMSDRILILKNGCLTGEFSRSETLTENDLIRVMI